VLDCNCAVVFWCGMDWLGWTVTVLWGVGLERIGCVGRLLFSRLWAWNEFVVPDGNCAVGCGPVKDLFCWTVTLLWSFGVECIGWVGR
jgi:hypothetical protein